MSLGGRRVAPTVAVFALLAWAAGAGGMRESRAGTTEVTAASGPGCGAAAVVGTDALHSLTNGLGVRQPFDGAVPAVACTLALEGWDATSRMSIAFWDPLTLAPRAGLVALRTRSYPNSLLYYNRLRTDFDPPLVTASLPGVAEAGPTALALDYSTVWAYPSQGVHYWSAGDPGAPTAQAYSSTGVSPLPGSHPVLGHGICRAVAPQTDLRVVQSVVTSDQPLGGTVHDYMQKFRVPWRCELNHVELAFVDNNYLLVTIGHLAIYDAGSDAGPPPAFPPALAEADFHHVTDVRTWDTHNAFVQHPVLEPGHDYWLHVYAGFGYPLMARLKHGNEPPAFTDAIGGLYTRSSPYQPWVDDTANWSLDFRLIGRPLEGLAVPPAAPAHGLRLAVEPNPVRGAAVVRWTGATGGAVRFEVLDPRGRRVARFEGAGEAGVWTWRGESDAGGPLPAGVYFVRAVDRDGGVSTARLVWLR